MSNDNRASAPSVQGAQAVAQGLAELERQHGHEAFAKAFNDRLGAWCAAAPRPEPQPDLRAAPPVGLTPAQKETQRAQLATPPGLEPAPTLTGLAAAAPAEPEPAYGEPWHVSESEIDPQMMYGLGSFVFNAGLNTEATRKVVERIVACVNACAGVATDDLQKAPGYKAAIDGFLEQRGLVVALRAGHAELIKERDKLRGALSEAEYYLKLIRAEELDGSEPELGQLLGRLTQVFINTGSAA